MGNKKDFFSPRIQEQAMLAVKEADVILFMVDTIEGLTHEDKMLASLLRKKGGDLNRTILVLANKVHQRIGCTVSIYTDGFNFIFKRQITLSARR